MLFGVRAPQVARAAEGGPMASGCPPCRTTTAAVLAVLAAELTETGPDLTNGTRTDPVPFVPDPRTGRAT